MSRYIEDIAHDLLGLNYFKTFSAYHDLVLLEDKLKDKIPLDRNERRIVLKSMYSIYLEQTKYGYAPGPESPFYEAYNSIKRPNFRSIPDEIIPPRRADILNNSNIVLHFQYAPEIVAAIRTLESVRTRSSINDYPVVQYSEAHTCWIISPITKEIISPLMRILMKYRFVISKRMTDMIEKVHELVDDPSIKIVDGKIVMKTDCIVEYESFEYLMKGIIK